MGPEKRQSNATLLAVSMAQSHGYVSSLCFLVVSDDLVRLSYRLLGLDLALEDQYSIAELDTVRSFCTFTSEIMGVIV